MDVKNEKVFHCSFCKKYSLFKQIVTKHEKTCKFNPENKTKCFEYCDHLIKESSYYDDITEEIIISKYYCKKKDKYMKSFKVKRNSFLLNRTKTLEFMPKECDLFFSSKAWIE